MNLNISYNSYNGNSFYTNGTYTTTNSATLLLNQDVRLNCGCIASVGRMKLVKPLCIFHDTFEIQEEP